MSLGLAGPGGSALVVRLVVLLLIPDHDVHARVCAGLEVWPRYPWAWRG
ncbi:hypothetical protein [Isoptericola sp. NPDC019482]